MEKYASAQSHSDSMLMRHSPLVIVAALFMVMLTSCFTGIEGTKEIKMSKSDRKMSTPKDEDRYLSAINGVPISAMERGRPFVVADARASVVMSPNGSGSPVDSLVGDTIYYYGEQHVTGIDGGIMTNLLFSDTSSYDITPGHLYKYTLQLTHKSQYAEVKSLQLPMLIDLESVDSVDALMRGKHLYLLSADWLDDNARRVRGRKFVEAVVDSVTYGTMVFPLKVSFTLADSRESAGKAISSGVYLMNFGNADVESRNFSTLFSLTDPRKRYNNISDDIWEAIINCRVQPGMTKEECRLSIGAPGDINTGRDYSRTLDLWIYPDGATLFFEDGRLVRTGVRAAYD